MDDEGFALLCTDGFRVGSKFGIGIMLVSETKDWD